jgi:uncharacterized protein (DUF433 family)
MPKDKLLERIDLSDQREPRLRDSGVPLDALIAYYRAMDGDIPGVAQAYRLPVEEVKAALEYYRRHPAVIDARLTLKYA